MPQVIETQVFEFDELSDAAKERARQWFRDCSDSSDLDHVITDAEAIASLMGIEMRTRAFRTIGGNQRTEPCVYWALTYCQGDGAAFDSRYAYRKGCAREVKRYASQDSKLHAIADSLVALQKRHGYRLAAQTWTGGDANSQSMRVELDDSCLSDAEAWANAESELRDILRRFADWIYWQLRTENDYQNSDEQVDENLRANAYTFTENGKRFG